MISNEKIPGAQRMAVALEKEKKELYKYIEDYVKQQYQLYNSVQNKIGNDEALQATKFSSMENHQIDEMARIRYTKNIKEKQFLSRIYICS